MGSNGVGKTSVLEAIYFLATTRSFRSSRLADCLRWGSRAFWVCGRLEGERGTELVASWQRGGSVRQVNGKNTALGDYLLQMSALSWSARDDRLIDGDSPSRRRLLDQGVVGRKPLEVEALTRYRRVLAAKRRLLTQAGRAAGESLDSWNELQADAGHTLLRLRSEYVTELAAAYAEVMADGGIELRPVEFRYMPSPEKGEESLQDFCLGLESVRDRELKQRRVVVGPHLDRLEFRWGDSDIGRSASAGERKLFGLVLTAARQKVLRAAGREPIMLLDDLDATLDRERLELAWRLFAAAPQVFVTSANPDTGRQVPGIASWRFGGSGIHQFR